ncbi:hypothetical protein NQ317_010378 [Molorchus minor]|uniref:Uncharacterized protein n=1 Tax=Molorchus minor TaxID=1323400 RepID=A0ABQ9IUS7_9CUCU|nr:hypothetical protein NQ317_010378 [Molorchus minor]
MKKQQLSAQQKQYTTEFKIENFIQLFPEPEKTFNDPNRNIKAEAVPLPDNMQNIPMLQEVSNITTPYK